MQDERKDVRELFTEAAKLFDDIESQLSRPRGVTASERDMQDVAHQFKIACHHLADGPPRVAGAVLASLEYGDMLRAATDRRKVVPTREAMMERLDYEIDDLTRRIEKTAEESAETDQTRGLHTGRNGVCVAFRRLCREREVVVHARDVL